jgi:F0F1-type ATP synthase membrane subunit b/b'
LSQQIDFDRKLNDEFKRKLSVAESQQEYEREAFMVKCNRQVEDASQEALRKIQKNVDRVETVTVLLQELQEQVGELN